MPDLIAQGGESQQRWRRSLPDGPSVVLGRAGAWAVPWDRHVSRQHARLTCRDGELRVTQLASASNPIYFRGRPAPRFSLRPGEHFVIGETSFTLVNQRVAITADAPQPLEQTAFSRQSLRQVSFHNPDHRIEVLTRLTEVLAGAGDDGELCVRLVSMLLAGIPRADAAAVVALGSGEAHAPIDVVQWDQRLAIAGDFCPSARLIREAAGLRQSVLQVWRGPDRSAAAFTEIEDVDWAFCTPLAGRTAPPWALYVAGRFGAGGASQGSVADPEVLREDIKFAELVAGMLVSLRNTRLLERQHASLRQFFSPVVLQTLALEDPDLVLAPRETRVSVLFCDLRGFSLETERHSGDLFSLLERVGNALGVMTQHIGAQGGVIGDFHGDAAMGFWGWPVAQPDAVVRACRAALAISSQFQCVGRQAEGPLAGFSAGIGIATGAAVAGKIGTVDQVKVTVFGPVVNLASRLEGMTKLLRAPILLDEATARAVRAEVPAEFARVRRLAVVRPYGMEAPLEVSELLPPVADFPQLTDEHIALYEEALVEFVAGRWRKAFELLHRIPADDRAKDFLTVHIAEHNRTPPEGFAGVVPLERK